MKTAARPLYFARQVMRLWRITRRTLGLAFAIGAALPWLVSLPLPGARVPLLSPGRSAAALAQTTTLTPTAFLPLLLVVQSGIRVFLVGFDPAGGEAYEHIHLINCDTKPVDVTGWRVRSPATGDVFVFPSYMANPGCVGAVQFTVNTHVTGFEDPSKGLFTWGQPLSREEWPNGGGSAEVYDASSALVERCAYNPADLAAPGDAYCR